MTTEETELTFIHCPGCRSLIPAIAKRCRMCGQGLEGADVPPPQREESAPPSKSRVRQRTVTVGGDEVESIKEQFDLKEPSTSAEPAAPAQTREAQVPRQAADFGSPASPTAESTPVKPPPLNRPLPPPAVVPTPPLATRASGPSVIDSIIQNVDELESKLGGNKPAQQQTLVNRQAEKTDAAQESPDQKNGTSLDVAADGEAAPKKRKRKRKRKKRKSGIEMDAEGVAAARDSENESSADEVREAAPREQRPEPVLPAEKPRRESTPEAKRERPDEVRKPPQRMPEQRVAVDQAPPISPAALAASARQETKKQGQQGKRDFANADSVNEKKEKKVMNQVNQSSDEFRAPNNSNAHSARGAAQQAATSELVGWLVRFEGAIGSAIELRAGRFFVSRERVKGSDLVIDDSSVSSPHCLVRAGYDGEGLKVQDLMSEEGTYVKAAGSAKYKACTEAVTLSHGDWLKLGDYEVMVCIVPVSAELAGTETEKGKSRG